MPYDALAAEPIVFEYPPQLRRYFLQAVTSQYAPLSTTPPGVA